MAVGDVTQLKLLQKSLTTTATDSAITNSGTSIKTTITSITLCNTSTTTSRIVTIYMYGTGTSNAINLKVDSNATVILTQLDYVLSSTESFYFKQDTGTDINISVMGITEVIS